MGKRRSCDTGSMAVGDRGGEVRGAPAPVLRDRASRAKGRVTIDSPNQNAIPCHAAADRVVAPGRQPTAPISAARALSAAIQPAESVTSRRSTAHLSGVIMVASSRRPSATTCGPSVPLVLHRPADVLGEQLVAQRAPAPIAI